MTKNEIRQQKKNEALNKIIFIHSKYFKYDQGWGDDDDESESCEKQRDYEVGLVLYKLQQELLKIKKLNKTQKIDM